MQRIVRFHAIGGPEVLQLERVALEAPGPDEVLLRVQAIGLNNSEAQLRRGDYGMMQADLPSRIGRECSGVVAAVGSRVSLGEGRRSGVDHPRFRREAQRRLR